MSSSSRSSTEQNPVTNQTDNRIGVEGNEFAQVLGGSHNQFEVLDAGAIQGAAEITSQAIDVISGAIDLISAGGDRLIGLSEASQEASLSALQQARDTEATGLARDALSQLVPLALVGGAAFVIWRVAR